MSEPAGGFQRFKITVAYDGRPFGGWQSQPGGNTVQDVLQTALSGICPAISKLHGSGRTDAGVSAEGQVAHFDAPDTWSMNARSWQKALNANLPPSVRVMAVEAAAHDFHARFSAEAKTYRYRIYTSEVLPPLLVGLVWHRPRTIDLDRIREVVTVFQGTLDFRAFSANRHDGHDEDRNSVRTIFASNLHELSSSEFEIEFTGSGFLYKMVRILVGASLEYHDEKRELPEIEKQLKLGEPFQKAPFCAPSSGLRLVNVRYRR